MDGFGEKAGEVCSNDIPLFSDYNIVQESIRLGLDFIKYRLMPYFLYLAGSLFPESYENRYLRSG